MRRDLRTLVVSWCGVALAAGLLAGCSSKTYTIGDVGPAGGTIVFDAGSDMEWGRYLELAPVGWDGSARDTRAFWCTEDTVDLPDSLFLGTDFDVGAGKANSEAIVAACGEESGAGLALSANFAGFDDWFLPSSREADFIKAAVKAGLLTDLDGCYQTSSPTKITSDFFHYCSDGSGTWSRLRSPSQVRPMRAF